VQTLTTRVCNNGNSQAVRIPAEFRLDTDHVSISRNESGDLVIHPLRAERGAALPQDARLCMSFVTWAELPKGAERSTKKPEVLRRLETLARQVAVLYPAGPTICEHNTLEFLRVGGLKVEDSVAPA
jgi:virulence-associated protein VagC